VGDCYALDVIVDDSINEQPAVDSLFAGQQLRDIELSGSRAIRQAYGRGSARALQRSRLRFDKSCDFITLERLT
jgi:hypothetical protein